MRRSTTAAVIAWSGKILPPSAKGLVGGDQQRAAIVPGADKLKEDAGFSLVFGDVGEVIEDQKVEFVELGDGGFESELATGKLIARRMPARLFAVGVRVSSATGQTPNCQADRRT